MLSLDGKYLGTISEGDLLWGMKTLNVSNLKSAEDISIMAIPRRATYKAVHADSKMEDLLDCAIQPELCSGRRRSGILYRYHYP